MATHRRPVLIGADLEEILDHHFREIAAAIPELLDLVERYTMRIARLEGTERSAMCDEFRTGLLGLLRTRFTVVLSDQTRLGQIA